MEKKKKICIVILEYQNPKMTLQTLKSLFQAIKPKGYDLQTVVVDNSPLPDGTLEKKLKEAKDVMLISSLQNTGFAAGNNLAIRANLRKGYQHFLLINNDVKVDKNFLVNLVKTAEKGADLVVPKIYFAKGYEFHKNRYQPSQLGKVLWFAGGRLDWDNVYTVHEGMNEVDKGQYDQEQEIEFANFCCVLIKTQVFKKIGLLNPNYFLYWEDADFATRARLAGFKLIYQPKAKIWHKSSGSSGSGSHLHDYYLTRNRLMFGFKYASFKTKFALIRESFRKLISGRPGEKKGIVDYYLRRWGKGRRL
jgi:hypothetical protein